MTAAPAARHTRAAINKRRTVRVGAMLSGDESGSAIKAHNAFLERIKVAERLPHDESTLTQRIADGTIKRSVLIHASQESKPEDGQAIKDSYLRLKAYMTGKEIRRGTEERAAGGSSAASTAAAEVAALAAEAVPAPPEQMGGGVEGGVATATMDEDERLESMMTTTTNSEGGEPDCPACLGKGAGKREAARREAERREAERREADQKVEASRMLARIRAYVDKMTEKRLRIDNVVKLADASIGRLELDASKKELALILQISNEFEDEGTKAEEQARMLCAHYQNITSTSDKALIQSFRTYHTAQSSEIAEIKMRLIERIAILQEDREKFVKGLETEKADKTASVTEAKGPSTEELVESSFKEAQALSTREYALKNLFRALKPLIESGDIAQAMRNKQIVDKELADVKLFYEKVVLMLESIGKLSLTEEQTNKRRNELTSATQLRNNSNQEYGEILETLKTALSEHHAKEAMQAAAQKEEIDIAEETERPRPRPPSASMATARRSHTPASSRSREVQLGESESEEETAYEAQATRYRNRQNRNPTAFFPVATAKQAAPRRVPAAQVPAQRQQPQAQVQENRQEQRRSSPNNARQRVRIDTAQNQYAETGSAGREGVPSAKKEIYNEMLLKSQNLTRALRELQEQHGVLRTRLGDEIENALGLQQFIKDHPFE